MAEKNPQKLYDILASMKSSMEDLLQDAQSLVNLAGDFGGEISRIYKEQMVKYFAPSIKKLIDDESTPGSIVGLIRFTDSVPLSMTRVTPSLTDDIAPIVPENIQLTVPEGTEVKTEVDSLPQNASFAKGTAPVQESLKKSHNKLAEAINKYQVIRSTNHTCSLGDGKEKDEQIIAEFETKEEAEERAKLLTSGLIPGEVELTGVEYKVKKI